LQRLLICDQNELKISVWDDDIGRDDLIGRNTIEMTDVLMKLNEDRPIKLHTKRGKFAGELVLNFDATNPISTTKNVGKHLAYPMARPSVKGIMIDASLAGAYNRDDDDAANSEVGAIGHQDAEDENPWEEQYVGRASEAVRTKTRSEATIVLLLSFVASLLVWSLSMPLLFLKLTIFTTTGTITREMSTTLIPTRKRRCGSPRRASTSRRTTTAETASIRWKTTASRQWSC